MLEHLQVLAGGYSGAVVPLRGSGIITKMTRSRHTLSTCSPIPIPIPHPPFAVTMTIHPFHRRAGLIVLSAVAVAGLFALPAQAGDKSVRGGAAAPASAPAAGKPEPVSRLIIRYRDGIKGSAVGAATPGAERAEAQAVVARSAARAGAPPLQYLKSVSPQMQVVALDQPISAAEAQALMQRLRADPAVLDVVVDQRVRPHAVPNDPSFTNGDQWHLRSPGEVSGGINAVAAWSRSTGAGVVIAVLDGGYTEHADLVSNILPGYDFVSGDPANSAQARAGQPFWTANDGNGRDAFALDPGDWVTGADIAAGFCDFPEPQSTWHGTHVAGIAAAVGNNNRSGLGVAYGAKILPVRVLGRCGGDVSDILAGARWAAGLPVPGVPTNPNPAKIIGLSLGFGGTCNATIQSTMDEVRATGASVIASSGNDGNTLVSVPANCAGVLAVTAHTREGDVAEYANVGRNVRISAPGGGFNTWLPERSGSPRGIVTTGNSGITQPAGDITSSLQGTSMAVPQVAGVLALLAAARPDLPMGRLEALMIDNARPFPAGTYCAVNPDDLARGFCGSGLLDAKAAVDAALGLGSSAGQGSEGGGGCTAAPNGQADASLLLLALAALGLTLWRRRR
jgi:serine protease